MLAQEGARLVGEQGVHKHVLFALGQIADLFDDLVIGGGDQARRSHIVGQHLGVARDLLHDLGVDASRGLAVVAADVILHLLGHDAPALAGEHVEHGLRAHDLRHGRDERRIADLCAHARDLLHDLGQAIGCVLHLELAHEVGHHAAGHLMRVHLHMDERGHAALIVAALAHFLPVFGDLEEQVQIKAGVVTAFLQCRHDHLDGGLGVAEGQRGGCGVDDGHARLGRLEVVGRGHAADVVAVQMHGQADLGVEGLHDALGTVRRHKAGHVLHADGVGAELLELLRIFKVAVKRMHRGDGVGDGALEVAAAFVDGLSGIHHVADIVERVEHAEHVHAVALGRLDEAVHDLAGIMLIADQVLTSGEHGQRRVRSCRVDGTQAVPWILIQKAHARVERRAAPCLDGPVADAIHLRQDRQHVADAHARRPQALLAVTDSGIHDLKP